MNLLRSLCLSSVMFAALWAQVAPAFAAALVGAPATPLTVIYPAPESDSDRRSEYAIELLKLAVGKSGLDVRLQRSEERFVQARAIRQLQTQQGLDVLWSMTSIQREADLRPIRIPIDKGLLGWRLLFVNQAALERFAGVRDLPQLKAFVAGQNDTWPDTEILRANGLQVRTNESYEGLFKMLGASRIDYFPRSVDEAWDELDFWRTSRWAMDPVLVLHYPAAKYFFVNQSNVTLATALEKGLRMAIKDGSFERLFQQYHGKAIRQSKLQERQVIELVNPILPPLTPLSERELWFKLQR